MKVSVCVTTLNEEKTISRLIESLNLQTKKPDEIIIVDGGSDDRTRQIIKGYKKIKLILGKGSRTKGRNIAVRKAKYDIIVTTDAGCVADKYWLSRIIEPFKYKSVDMVAGFYKMSGKTPFQKALKNFLGTTPEKFDSRTFLPSTRSMAFRKSLWKSVDGFSENLKGAIDDTDFNYKVAKHGAKIVRVKNAIVEWGIPDNLVNALRKFYGYAKGDAESKVFWNPAKGFKSHNIKVILIFLRYLVGASLFILSLLGYIPFVYWFMAILLYALFAYRKGGFWGIIIQFSSDISVMLGFISGILS